MAVIDDVEEHVGGVGAVSEIGDLVDHEDMRLQVVSEGFAQPTGAAGGGKIVDERGRGGEECGEAILDGAAR